LAEAFPAFLGTQMLVVAAFAAFGFLSAVLTSRYIIVGLVYGAIIEVGVGQIPTQLNRLSMTHQVQSMLHRYMVNGVETIPPVSDGVPAPVAGVLATTALLVAFAVIMLAFAAAVFSFLELVGPEEA
jgi:hypothetical protein